MEKMAQFVVLHESESLVEFDLKLASSYTYKYDRGDVHLIIISTRHLRLCAMNVAVFYGKILLCVNTCFTIFIYSIIALILIAEKEFEKLVTLEQEIYIVSALIFIQGTK